MWQRFVDHLGDKFERYISKDRHNAHLHRKDYTAIPAKMARTV